MKKLCFIIALASLFMIGGCRKFLEEDLSGKVVGDAVLTSQEGLEAALTGAYKGLNTTWGRGFMPSTIQAVTMGGDDLTTLPGSNKAPFRQFDQLNVSAANARGAIIYNGCYKTIQGANNVINNYKKTTGDSIVINTIAGEAYFLRGFSYYWLTRLYGSIPLIKTAEFSLDKLTINASSPKEVYQLIEHDFKKAAQMLPNQKRAEGRPNKGSALAFLADVYLTEGGWPIQDVSKYELAYQTAAKVIAHHDDYGFGFMANYADIFKNDPSTDGTIEDIFDITANNGNGNSANASLGYSAMPSDIGGWSDYYAELKFFHDFPDGLRKEVTFATSFMVDGASVSWKDLSSKHPFYKKCWINGGKKTWSSSLPAVMMRYTNVLLVYAEAKARTGSLDSKAYKYLNMVRTRGGENPIPMSSLSPADFTDSVVRERAWEFAAEGVRWFDLVRLQMVEEVNENKNPGDLQPIGQITKEDYTFPLPLSETLANPNLK